MMKSRNRHWNLLAIVVILLLAASSLNGIGVEAARKRKSRRHKHHHKKKTVPSVPPPPTPKVGSVATTPPPPTPKLASPPPPPTPKLSSPPPPPAPKLASPPPPPAPKLASPPPPPTPKVASPPPPPTPKIASPPPPPPGTQRLKVGYYAKTVCKNVESVVKAEVLAKSKQDFTIIPALIRIYFHDCFANGQCDASLLIKKMPSNAKTELDATTNEGIRGLDFIDYLKRKVLASCGGANLVSCADIIALATRDAVAIASGRGAYAIPTGRLDGKVSIQASGNSLPGSRNPISAIVGRFKTAGFSAEETVLLSGAHSIGQTRCRFFNDRLYKFSVTTKPDPTMSVALADQLRKTCSASPTDNNRVFLDQGTSSKLDKSYFTQITKSRGVLQSDQNLLVNAATRGFVTKYAAGTEADFGNKFEAAMIKLGNLGYPMSGSKGDIRKVCSVLN